MSLQRDTLRVFSPFDRLSDEYLDKVLEKAEWVEIPRGTLIFKRGKTLDVQHYLVSGRVDLIDAQFQSSSLEAGSDNASFPLADHSPTQVSAVAKTDVELIVLERDFLDLVMAWSQSGDHPEGDSSGADDHDWMSYLLESPLFTRVPPGHIQQLFVRFEEIDVEKGESIVREGEPGDYFYVLESGRASVTDKAGRVLAELGAGSYFGEEALVGDTTRNANVDMLTAGRLMRLEKADFKTLLQEPVVKTIPASEWGERSASLGEFVVLDVRLVVERRFGKLEGSRNVPLGQLRGALDELDKSTAYVVSDDAGRRSDVAVQLLAQAGLEVYLLTDAAQLHGQPLN
ncbi:MULTISPECIES: cyclic nucleotide-binding domain-containing protein [Marinimicrobium]|jgi:CRP-like cAMP-binding protein/rhodanese-related sulfurtransferase|uniref:Cyclic nucleotide-binding protein n=1 Tax=Marinimicrobium koreense TaxID=306545 RepID=A0A3N1NWR9_9GAMM|nr:MULTISPECIES: cyclic nucleotide-binding domain-containing protein [Marinimicrobium]ROQ19728.1 cyclic nucleotide-binding protein [Marinimicrobium koreense]|tara:strand:- start:92 stop:1120 length:1029 start_codon:yes stop_codon:yes gene_type:complete